MKSIFRRIAAAAAAAGCSALIASCSTEPPGATEIPVRELTLLARTALPFGGLSGLAYSEELQKLWIVSGENQRIYRLDMYGNVEKRLDFKGTDLEGIVFDPADSTLWTVDEATKEITHIDRGGDTLSIHRLSYSTTSNKGPEGITLGPAHRLYVLNERNPSILIKLDSLFEIDTTYTLGFALDYSDVWCTTAGTFYILSDESGAFYEWSESKGVIASYPLLNTGNEGLVYDRIRQVFYVCNKTTDSLYIYTLAHP